MSWVRASAAMLLATSIAFAGAAFAADAHDHQAAPPEPPKVSAPAVQSSQPELPALGNADDMLKAMESMPAHDHDACCQLAKSPPKTSGHSHSH